MNPALPVGFLIVRDFRLAASLQAARRLLVALMLPVSSAGVAHAQAPAPGAAVPDAQAACTLRELSRVPLVLDGHREAYIEPRAVLASGREILLAGTPTYVWAPGFPGMVRDFTSDSLFGIVIGADGRARVISPPISPAHTAYVRGVSLPEGGWALAFAETRHPHRPEARDSVVRFWYGVYDGTSWTRLEQLPPPPEPGVLITSGSSNLLVQGDTTWLAIRRSRPGDVLAEIALYERRHGRWSVTILQPDRVAAANLAYRDSSGLQVTFVGADLTRYSDRNSLFVQIRNETDTTWRRVVLGDRLPLYDPVSSISSRGPVLTWFVDLPGEGRRLQAMVGAIDPANQVVQVASRISRFAPVLGRNGPPLWLTQHPGPGASSRLHVTGLGADGKPYLVGAIPDPYTGSVSAYATGPDDFIAAGPHLRAEPPNPSLVTLFIRLRVECASRAP